MSQSKVTPLAVLGILLAAGIIGSSYVFKSSLENYINSQNTVHVKGLAEKTVPADLAIWPITFQNVSNDLKELEAKISKDKNLVVGFLENHGFKQENMTFTIPKISDAEANQYSSGRKKAFRYSAESTISLRTSKVEAVKIASAKSNILVKQGIVLGQSGYGRQIEYFFTGLNKIKPPMIEEATKNARLAAQQFAKDSNSEVGRIKTATQGIFSIRDRDQYSPDLKKIRVVTSVQFQLNSF